MPRAGLDAEVARLLEVQRRFLLIYNALGMDDVARIISGALIVDPGPWPDARLAAYVRQPRTTIRRRLDDYASIGLVERGAKGSSLTPEGVAVSVGIVTEALAVATGAQPRLSAQLLDRIAAAIATKSPEQAKAWRVAVEERVRLETFPPLPAE